MKQLKKDLKFIHIFSLATGAMISSGIFILPGLAHAKAGPSVIFSYLLAGLMATIGMLNTAELATAMPKAGGDYFFITRSLGSAVGSVAGLLNWFSLSLKSAFALVGMAAFVSLFLKVDIRFIGIMLTGVFVVMNLAGSKHAGRAQIIFVLGLLGIMVFYIVRGLPFVSINNLSPFVPYGFNKTLATAGFVFVSYGGLLKISSVAEEVRNPAKTIPQGMFWAVFVVTILYTLIVFITSGVLPAEILDNSLTPITDGARAFLSPWGVRVIGLAAILSFISTANAGIMAASRYLFALGRDELLPRWLSRLTSKTQTPYLAIFITGLFVMISLFLEIDTLVEAASLVLILSFILSSICVIVLRESHVQNYRPSFTTPFYPIPQIVGLLGFTLLIFEIGLEAYFISALLFALGMMGYWFFGRKRVRKEYALLHVIQRVTSKELVTGSLERELKEIVRERDDIALDRFDRIINNSIVLDIPNKIDSKTCFKNAAEQLAPRVDMDPGQLAEKLLRREEESSTVLTPFLAVPHVVIPGNQRFDIALVRAQKGIYFSEKNQNVKALFILVGSIDERNFHLQALSSVAQIFQEPKFENLWMKAKNTDNIRDVVLLGKRYRDQSI